MGAASGGSGTDDRWRVFISHTSELRKFPRGRSYVSEVERAIAVAGHVVVDMEDFPAADQPPAEMCEQRVRGCDVYIGVFGTRYGFPVRNRPEVSYTELEFDTATDAGLDRLIFVLDADAENLGIPLKQLTDNEHGQRQDMFRRRVRDSSLTTKSFGNPDQLGRLVERSLRDLADTRRRISSGIEREQIPAEPQPVRASKFVNPPPAVAPTWFQGRQVETGLLAKFVMDAGIRMVTVLGRGGIGKTAMVCRLLKGLEAGRIPGSDRDPGTTTVAGIVYLSQNGVHPVTYPTLIEDMLRLLPADVAQRLHRRYQDPHHTPREMMLALLEAFPAGDPVLVLLDNVESVMDTTAETLTEPALLEALTAVLTAPAHAVTVIATTRVAPADLLKVESAGQRQLRLDGGLGSPDAETVLRELDDDGNLGLRDAPDDLLDGLRRHTRGVPRALEAIKAILEGDGTLTPRDLLDRTRELSEDRVVQVLVGEAYELLDAPGQQVMQALSVYPGPVSAVAVDFLLRPMNPTINTAPILARLVRRQLVRFQDGQYHLHPLDREYASGQLPAGGPDDFGTELTLTHLRARAADYYAQIRSPRDSWRTLDDVRSQLAEFELRCDTGDYDTAADVLADIDFDYLQLWGHYRVLVDLHARIQGKIGDPSLNADHLINLGLCHAGLGNYRSAINLHTQALTIYREIDDRQGESSALGNLGTCYASLGDYRRSIELHTQALTISREIGDRKGESSDLRSLGVCEANVGNFWLAIELHSQALTISHEIGDRLGEGSCLGSLGFCQYSLGDYPKAINLHTQALAISRETGDRQGESADLSSLGLCHFSLGDYPKAIELHSQALTISHEIDSLQSESNQLGNLGLCHFSLGDYTRAIHLHNHALTISRETGDRQGESIALSNLGLCHASLGDYLKAINLQSSALSIAREIGNRQGESSTLGNLGLCHFSLGDYTKAINLHTQGLTIAREIGNRQGESNQLGNLGLCHFSLGDYTKAINLHTQGLTIAREIGNRQSESNQLSNLGLCHDSLGDYTEAINLHTQALTIAREIGYRYNEGNALSYLGRSWLASGNASEAAELLEQAVLVADSTRDIEPAVEARSWLARTRLELGDPAGALALTIAAQNLPFPTEQATLGLLRGVALLELGRTTEAMAAFNDAVATADTLLAIADRNVAGLQARALALSGLAAATGEAARAAQAADAFLKAEAVTKAAGVVADSARLLARIEAHERAGHQH